MHFVAYVLLPKAEATTSLEARHQVYDELLDDPSFFGDGGRFSTPICDWFEIGGRWSGWLYSQPLREEFFYQADQLNVADELGEYSNDFINHHREQLDDIWHKLGGANASPLTRNPNGMWGEEDDAHLLDKPLAELLNTFLSDTKQYSHENCLINRSEWGLAPIVISLDDEEDLFALKDFNDLIGQYWVVVIDYHK